MYWFTVPTPGADKFKRVVSKTGGSLTSTTTIDSVSDREMCEYALQALRSSGPDTDVPNASTLLGAHRVIDTFMVTAAS
jgi:hypothetical protein